MKKDKKVEERVKKKPLSANAILADMALEEDAGNYIEGINWTDDPYYENSWKRLKIKNLKQIVKTDSLFQLFSTRGKIVGKPQIRDNEIKTNITLVVRACKNNKEAEEGFDETFKFVDDHFDKRFDGQDEEVLEEAFWVYDVVQEGIKYIVLCGEKLDNFENHIFHGTTVKINHAKEFDKNLVCRGSSNLFFCHSAESSIKPMPKEEIIPYVQEFMKKNDWPIEKFRI